MSFLRTASTGRLLATIAAALVAVAVGAAIAVAATGSGPTPPPATLAQAVHRALVGAHDDPVAGVSADITFTDNLIDSSDFTGHGTDPLLQGASGRLWLSPDGRMRLELQSDDGDAQIVVDHRSWWISDPAQNVVYEGTLSGSAGMSAGPSGEHGGSGVPGVGRIATVLQSLMSSVSIAGPAPVDVAGRPAYQVTVSPKVGAGLLGSVQLAWDAARGVPLQFALYARGDTTPVLGLQATNISYGAVPASVFTISPPAGAHVVSLGDGSPSSSGPPDTGLRQVAAQVQFPLHPPAALLGRPRTGVRLVDLAGVHGALVDYGHGLDTIAVIETRALPGNAAMGSLGGLSLPTRTIDGATATVLSTPLGTVLHLQRSIGYTVLGSITAADAQAAAQQLVGAR